MKSLISYPKHVLSTILVFFVFLMIAEAQILADYSQLRRTDGLVLQRLTHDGSQTRKCVMNFHSDIADENDPNSESFDYVYLRATETNDEENPNNLVLTSDGMLVIGESEKCYRIGETKADAQSVDTNIKLFVKGQIAVNDGSATSIVVSDERFKKNIKPIKNSLEVIRKSNFVEYQYNDLSGISPDRKYYGVLAQEMEKILPNTVTKTRRTIRPTDKKSTEFYMFNPNDLIYSGLNAIKELDKENQVLKGKIAEETAKNEVLEKRVSELEKILKTLIRKEGVENPISPNTNLTSARLYQNTPNPSHQSTDIEYYLPDNVSVAHIIIQNLSGQTVAKFDLQNSGLGRINFNAKKYGISTGSYVYSLVINGLLVESKKMIFTK